MRARVVLAVLALLVVLQGTPRTSSAEGDAFEVIVNPDNGVDAVDRDFLREAYLKKVIAWGDGTTVLPIDLSERYPARAHFTEAVLRKTPAQLRTYWSQQIFSGKGVPPPEARSPADVIAYVLANRGAVGYLPAGFDPGHAKVVRLE